MTPPTVNAYYDPTVNQIVFPAGILQPPFFDPNADPAVNYGGIGAVIGHESTHGFDDQGSLYDKFGNLNDQWTKTDRVKFTAKTQCIINQFNQLSPEPGVKENGALVVGEETADLGGVTLAYRAFEKWQSTHPRLIIDGYTPEQRFFFGWAHVWQELERPAVIKLLAETDVHAYPKFRVNATLSNMPAFAKAWSCPLNSPMVRPAAERCQIW
jgi:putative endopeptidase